MKREYKACYSFKCPRCCNCHCVLSYDEKVILSERFGTNVYCLIAKNGVLNFSYENDPQFIQYCEYLDSLKVIDKLKEDYNG